MPQQIINLGATGSGAGGDSARTAFEKAIANFAELYIAALPGTAAQKQAARDMFGLGTAATRAVQTGPNDTTAGALMAVGAFGLGRVLDLRNTVFETGSPADVFGKGMVTGFARGGPDGLAIPAIPGSSVYGILTAYGHWTDVTGAAASAWREFRTGGSLSRVFHQSQAGGAWSQWREVFHTGNILGTVSQSGGVPTGAIIERGSNANGEYVRFADGTQICTRRVSALSLASLSISASGAGGGFRSSENTVAFAASFAAPPVTSVALTNNAQNVFATCYAASSSGWSVVFRTAGTAVVITDAFTVELKAEGRWY